MTTDKKDARIRRILSLIKMTGKYECKKCGNKKFSLASKKNKNKSKIDWVKCDSCGHEESATANTFFHEFGMPLSKACELLDDIQSNYIDAEDNNRHVGVSEYDNAYRSDDEEYRPLRLSIRKIAEQNGMQTKNVMKFFERLKNWLPKQYHQKNSHLNDVWLDGIKTEKWRQIFTALFHLLFEISSDEERTGLDILFHLVLKEPENTKDWWVIKYPWMVEK